MSKTTKATATGYTIRVATIDGELEHEITGVQHENRWLLFSLAEDALTPGTYVQLIGEDGESVEAESIVPADK